MTSTMKAILITRYGGPEVLEQRTVPMPEAAAGSVVVRVRAFGLNHAEAYFRRGVWGEVARISGIECAGEVHDPGSTGLAPGQPVFALMGGMGRTIDGSYAEYVRVPEAHAIPIRSRLDWIRLAALPESYATAWIFLRQLLEARRGQTLLVRGGASALGQAAINLARLDGVDVLATTRSPGKLPLLAALGAEPLLDDPDLREQVRRRAPEGVDAVLEVVGNRTLLASLQLARYGGRVAMAGFLGGADPLAGFDPLRDLPSGVQLSFFASAFLFGTPAVPMSSIPFQSFVDAAEAERIRAEPAHVFPFDRTVEAHRLMESGQARGKIVIDVVGGRG
jgi:NADPH:quinone reductase-like Zn-dependent oxidoreductase